MFSIFILLLLALVFVYINGFHDTSNSIATVVATRALSPRQAIYLATVTNLAGALVGTAVAATIAHDLVDAHFITINTIIAALLGAIVWDLLTWWWGLPSSSSHALVGGLCGAVIASEGGWHHLIWAAPSGSHWWLGNGIFYKVILPMFFSPLLGLVGAFVLLTILYLLLRSWPTERVDKIFGKLQIFSGGYIGFAHGHNDAQKTIGIIVLALVAATQAGLFEKLPGWLAFLRHPGAAPGEPLVVETWLKVVCAVVLAAGTAAGGWRIIQTVGRKITELKPIHGFAAETTAASVLTAAAAWGFPVSTTHTLTAAVGGVGTTRKFSVLKMGVVQRIFCAWVFTLPAAAIVAAVFMFIFKLFGLK